MIENEKQEFIVTARKWRPQQFADVVGQSHISDTLINAIKSGRIHHAYLFTGPRGVGKTTSARIFARAVNCKSPIDFEPCNVCESCRTILENRSMDVIEIDGASNNSVDDIRILRENVKFPPSSGKYKIYIIDEVHMLSKQAFNALLKTLEEPPKHLIFIFATTEAHKVLPTIISRCQKFDFRRMEINDIIRQLKFIAEKEQIIIDEDSLLTIAKKADGSMRDSQSIFDQVVAFCGTTINYKELADSLNLIDQDFFFNITDAISDKNSLAMLSITSEVIKRGYDLQDTMQGILEHLRNVLSIKLAENGNFVETSKTFLNKYRETAKNFDVRDLVRMMTLVNQAEQQLKFSPQPSIKFEMTLLQLSTLDSIADIAGILKEIRNLDSINISIPSTKDSNEKKNQLIPTLPKKQLDNVSLIPAKKNKENIEQVSEVELPKSVIQLETETNNKINNADLDLNPIERYLIANFHAEKQY